MKKITTEIVLTYLDLYPKMGSTALAAKIFKERKGIFENTEAIRGTIRYFRGTSGEKNRRKLKIKKCYSEGASIISAATRIPKILLFDIETSPNASYNWGWWKQNIQHQQIIFPWMIISWAGKWLYEAKCFGDVLSVEEAKGHDDKRVCESLLKAFNDADIIIAHNGKKFDDKRSKTRFFINELQPPEPYQMIDTLEHFRKEFVMPSNRLDYLISLLYDDSKLPTEFALWPKCLNWFNSFSKEEQQESLDYMFKYNKKDVYTLEDLYIELRPWIKNHPNIGLYMNAEGETCTHCGSSDLSETGSDYYTGVNRFTSLRCNNCGAIGGRRRETLIKVNKGEKKGLAPVAR